MNAKGRHGHAGNENKTHCRAGHPYDEANTYRWRGHRFCRSCNAAASRRVTSRKNRAAS